MAPTPTLQREQRPRSKRTSLALEFLTSSFGVATATTITQPIDLVKTRMQLELLKQRAASPASPAAAAAAPRPTGLFATAAGVVRREGLAALWGGAAPAAVRGMSYGGLRLGLYGPLRDALAAAEGARRGGGSGDGGNDSPGPSFGLKLAAGAISGAVAAAVTSPTELIKVRMQAEPASAAAAAATSSSFSAAAKATTAATTATPPAPAANVPKPPAPPSWSRPVVQQQQFPAGLAGMACSAPSSSSSSQSSSGGGGGGGLRALSSAAAPPTPAAGASTAAAAPGGFQRIGAIVRQVVADDGVRGLWRGATPGMIRAAVLTASQCATYDAAKRRLALLTNLPSDSVLLQAGCAMLTGLASTTATQPVDVVKTHMFVARRSLGAAGAGGAGTGGGTMAATARRIYDAHGLRGFFRGWTANYARLGPMTVLIFVTTESCRRRLGMESL